MNEVVNSSRAKSPLNFKDAITIALSVGAMLSGVLLTIVLAVVFENTGYEQYTVIPLFFCVGAGTCAIILMGNNKTLRDGNIQGQALKNAKTASKLIAYAVFIFINMAQAILIPASLDLTKTDTVTTPVLIGFAAFFALLTVGVVMIILGAILWKKETAYSN